MSLKEFMALVLLVEFIILILMLIWAIPIIIDSIVKSNSRNKFGKELSALFEKNKLNRKQIEILAKEYFLNPRDIQLVARRQFKKSLTSEHVEKNKSDYFQILFEDYERDEPFEGLPSDVRLHLERVRDALGKENDHMLQPLASQLQDLNDENIRKHKKMWWISVMSLMFSIASLAFAAYVYYNPIDNVKSVDIIEHNNAIQPMQKNGASD
ncbi:hypothetical protein WCT78_14985 [Pectobacterium versatile]|uniref:hypothetical protein n=1 Tax=Pectobacterium versatile TaxID=2488639 RepID=UPI00102F06BD|nr:hypothetical protein [Pectobacterium versatile]MBQ4773530.1 hypothetical protein [Pectobacterium versatile]MBQ4789234.1 hypothetical protein [Pectobacterium versatile]TAI85638.1 hypothetical protein EG333_14455 [Pectobacterium versatile]